MLMEPFTQDLRTSQQPHSEPIPFRLFPWGTKMVGPVVILQRQAMARAARVLISHKLIFPDGAETVIAAECRALWGSAAESAFDVAPSTTWKIAASSRGGVIIGTQGMLNA